MERLPPPPSVRDYYSEGKMSFYAGKDLLDNPYIKERHLIRHTDWIAGFLDAKHREMVDMGNVAKSRISTTFIYRSGN